jgi:hypothetical protein
MARSVWAGGAYFLMVFVLGFALGTVRVLYVAPRLGAAVAVLLEAPIMLGASWAACGWCLRRFEVPPGRGPRGLMGALAFALMIAAELGVAVLVFGQGPAGFIAAYRSLPGAVGLAAQAAFGLMPLVRRGSIADARA